MTPMALLTSKFRATDAFQVATATGSAALARNRELGHSLRGQTHPYSVYHSPSRLRLPVWRPLTARGGVLLYSHSGLTAVAL